MKREENVISTVLGIVLLLVAVVVANIVHLIWPVMHLAIYQVLAGVILAILPTAQTLGLDPEIFMILIIAPLMFNEGQNSSARQLTRNIRQLCH